MENAGITTLPIALEIYAWGGTVNISRLGDNPEFIHAIKQDITTLRVLQQKWGSRAGVIETINVLWTYAHSTSVHQSRRTIKGAINYLQQGGALIGPEIFELIEAAPFICDMDSERLKGLFSIPDLSVKTDPDFTISLDQN